MRCYLDLLDDVLARGVDKEDRTGTGTRSLFGYQLRFNLAAGFPLLTTKKVFFRGVVYELLWFLRGDTHIGYLEKHGVKIWHPWADAQGNLGRIYGAQWRSWRSPSGKTIDQISAVIDNLKEDPHSRRHLVVAYNPGELEEMALPPCHAFFQFYMARDRLSCQLYQRSADAFLGVPFNIASYSLLTMMVAHELGVQYGEFIHTFGDVHLYHNHFHQARQQLSRTPRTLPSLSLNPEVRKVLQMDAADIRLEGYHPHPTIRAPIAV